MLIRTTFAQYMVNTNKSSVNTYNGHNRMRGIGMHVNVTVMMRNGFRPQLSDNAPMSGALRNDNSPYSAIQQSVHDMPDEN